MDSNFNNVSGFNKMMEDMDMLTWHIVTPVTVLHNKEKNYPPVSMMQLGSGRGNFHYIVKMFLQGPNIDFGGYLMVYRMAVHGGNNTFDEFVFSDDYSDRILIKIEDVTGSVIER